MPTINLTDEEYGILRNLINQELSYNYHQGLYEKFGLERLINTVREERLAIERDEIQRDVNERYDELDQTNCNCQAVLKANPDQNIFWGCPVHGARLSEAIRGKIVTRQLTIDEAKRKQEVGQALVDLVNRIPGLRERNKHILEEVERKETIIKVSGRAIDMAIYIYQQELWSGLPVLADLLEEDGCCSEAVLRHLRSREIKHGKNCWVLTAIITREWKGD